MLHENTQDFVGWGACSVIANLSAPNLLGMHCYTVRIYCIWFHACVALCPACLCVDVRCFAVLDESSQTLFLTELWRGLNFTLRAFFDRKVTVSVRPSQDPLVSVMQPTGPSLKLLRPVQRELGNPVTGRSTTRLRRAL
jgi:hypothetical protein